MFAAAAATRSWIIFQLPNERITHNQRYSLSLSRKQTLSSSSGKQSGPMMTEDEEGQPNRRRTKNNSSLLSGTSQTNAQKRSSKMRLMMMMIVATVNRESEWERDKVKTQHGTKRIKNKRHLFCLSKFNWEWEWENEREQPNRLGQKISNKKSHSQLKRLAKEKLNRCSVFLFSREHYTLGFLCLTANTQQNWE